MNLVFNPRKAQQAVAYLQRKHPKLSSAKVAKLLLLADRQSFVETGYPITGAELVSLPAFIASTAMAWQGAHAAGEDELSVYERGLLDRVMPGADEDVPEALPEELLRQAGKSDQEIHEVALQVEEHGLLENALASARR